MFKNIQIPTWLNCIYKYNLVKEERRRECILCILKYVNKCIYDEIYCMQKMNSR